MLEDARYAKCEGGIARMQKGVAGFGQAWDIFYNDSFTQGCTQKVEDHVIVEVGGALALAKKPHFAPGPTGFACIYGGAKASGPAPWMQNSAPAREWLKEAARNFIGA